MRHRSGLRKLNRTSAHRLAMLRNMMVSLIKHEAIKTTLPKAKELRRVIEPMITLAKEPTLANKRLAFSRLRDREAVVKLFGELGPRFAARQGGYTRILKMGFRVGDNASVKQDDFDSLVGGVGLTLGFSCPNDRGDVYLRLDQKYDFQGETSTGFYSNGREVNRFDKDLGGSWFEIGLGAKARLTESLTGYAEFETAHSGEVETPFRWNLGMRYTF